MLPAFGLLTGLHEHSPALGERIRMVLGWDSDGLIRPQRNAGWPDRQGKRWEFTGGQQRDAAHGTHLSCQLSIVERGDRRESRERCP